MHIPVTTTRVEFVLEVVAFECWGDADAALLLDRLHAGEAAPLAERRYVAAAGGMAAVSQSTSMAGAIEQAVHRAMDALVDRVRPTRVRAVLVYADGRRCSCEMELSPYWSAEIMTLVARTDTQGGTRTSRTRGRARRETSKAKSEKQQSENEEVARREAAGTK